jgi:hypothetical protein
VLLSQAHKGQRSLLRVRCRHRKFFFTLVICSYTLYFHTSTCIEWKYLYVALSLGKGNEWLVSISTKFQIDITFYKSIIGKPVGHRINHASYKKSRIIYQFQVLFYR